MRGRLALGAAALALLAAGCPIASNLTRQTTVSVVYEEDDLDDSCSTEGATVISLSGDSISVEGPGVSVEGTTATISADGVYAVSGTLSDGKLLVSDASGGTVRVILNGAAISCSTDAPLRAAAAGKLVLTLGSGTVANRLSDSSGNASGAALSAACDLSLNGSGSLEVDGNAADGVACSDLLKLVGGSLTVKAADDGLRGHDGIAAEAADPLSVSVTAGGDGITSDYGSESGETDADRGFVLISGGSFSVSAAGKGIKGHNALQISGGSFGVTSSDDSLHSSGDVRISGGSFVLSAGSLGQGIKAGDSATLSIGGDSTDIAVSSSREGLAGKTCTIDGGTLRITALNDGFSVSAGTVAGGSESDDGSLLTINGGYIVVTVDASASGGNGDGVDSNGDIVMNGGTLIVRGPTSQPEVGIDCNGSFTINGGTVLAAADLNSMTTAPTGGSQRSVLVRLSAAQAAGTLVDIRSGAADLVTFAPSNAYQSLIYSSPSLTAGLSCTVYLGGSYSGGSSADGFSSGGTYSPGTSDATFAATSVVTTCGSGAATGGVGGGGGGPGGF